MTVILSAVMLLLGIALIVSVFMLIVTSFGFEKDLHDWLQRKIIKHRCGDCKFYSEHGCAHPCESLCKGGSLWQKKERENK